MADGTWTKYFNLKGRCSRNRVGLWQCPEFLFVIMGVFIIVAVLATYTVAQRFAEPELVALIVLGLAGILFVIGYLIVSAFERVAQAARSKSEFIGIMSHQLRSPLSAIKWQLDVLRSDSSEQLGMTDHAVKYLEAIDDQNERMIRLVNDLLEVNRIEDRDLLLRPSSFSSITLSKKVIDHYARYALANNVRVVFFATPDVPAVFADEERIHRVLEHLLDNAIRYSVKGGEVSISIEERNGDVVWKVADQGGGIAPEERTKLFTKFFRTSGAVKDQTEGFGLGLFVAKSIVELSGGKIGFLPNPERGSTFWFSLPANSKDIPS